MTILSSQGILYISYEISVNRTLTRQDVYDVNDTHNFSKYLNSCAVVFIQVV